MKPTPYKARTIANSELVDADGKKTGRKLAILDVFDGDLVRVVLDADDPARAQSTWAHSSEIGKASSTVADLDAHLSEMPSRQLASIDSKHAGLFGVKPKALEDARAKAIAAQRAREEKAAAEAKAAADAREEKANAAREEARAAEAERVAAAELALEMRVRAIVREERASASAAPAETPAPTPAPSAPSGPPASFEDRMRAHPRPQSPEDFARIRADIAAGLAAGEISTEQAREFRSRLDEFEPPEQREARERRLARRSKR